MSMRLQVSLSSHSLLEAPWKSDILGKLRKRNHAEGESFKPMFAAYGKLFELAESLKSQNKNLNSQLERIEARTTDACDPRASDKVAGLEQKIYRLQEELTELHRRKGDNAQQLVDMRNRLQEQEMIIFTLTSKNQDHDTTISSLQLIIKESETTIADLQRSNQLLREEQQAVQTAYCAMEEKARTLEMDYQELVDRWLKLKSAEVEEKNREAENFIRRRKSSMLQDILEAVRQPVKVKVDESWEEFVMPACCVIVPSVAQRKIDAHESEVNAVRWSPMGRYFATGGADKKVKIWENNFLSRPDCRGTLTGPNAAVMSVDFDPGETLVMASSNDFAVHLWSIADQRLKHKLTGHKEKVLASKFLAGSSRVVSGSYDRTLKLWDLQSGGCVQNFFAGSSCNDLIVYGSQNVVSGHFDGKIRFWDTRSAQNVNELVLRGKITSLDLSSDGFYLLSCTRDDMLHVIDVRMNEVKATLTAENFKVGRDWSRAVFSPDGQYAMAGSNDGVLYVWNLRPAVPNVEKMLSEHLTTITACSWHPQGTQLLSCDRSQRVILWGDMEIRG